MGTQVGQEAGQLFKAAGWTASDTKVLAEWQQDVTVCGDRVKAAETAFAAAAGVAVRSSRSVRTTASPVLRLDRRNAERQPRREALGRVGLQRRERAGCGHRALQNGGVNASNIVGVGLGAYLACKDWGKLAQRLAA